MLRRFGTSRCLFASAWLVVVSIGASCSTPAREPMQISRDRLIIENQTDEDWTNVRILVNRYFHGGASELRAGGRLDVHLDALVSGYGRRFEPGRIPIRDVRLTASRPNGEPVELVKELSSGSSRTDGGR
jgi:hypothetical protein